MRKIVFIFIIAQCLCLQALSQYWQQQVNYTIDVSLNDKENTLDGFEKLDYFNNSPDTLQFIWFHLWPNAYKNDKTAFSDQLLENGQTKFYFSNKDQRGYINRLDFKVNNQTAAMEDHPQHIDIIKILLPAPLPPGEKITITTPFHVKLPFNFSRSGYDGESYQVTQWFPKPAVYDKKGWHPIPYLDQGEFYSEFGNFDVQITVPKNYVIAATGELQNKEEKEWMNTRTSFNWQPVKEKEKTKWGQMKTIYKTYPESEKEAKTLRFKQTNIHDFAWFADKRFIVNQDTCLLASGKIINVITYYTPSQKEQWSKSVQYCKDAVRHYTNLVGEYPYSIVQAVQGPASFGGGMEYPTITVISPEKNTKNLDNTIAHEIGHNWFYGILATNERTHPWMDEGINSFYDDKYRNSKYGNQPPMDKLSFETMAATEMDQPIESPSEKFSEKNYSLTTYYKAAEWMRYLESQLGKEVFNHSMQAYFREWQFKHPEPEDFKQIFEKTSNQSLDSAFSYLTKTGILPTQQRSGSKTAFIFNVNSLKNYINNPTKNLFLFGPSIGNNAYDKIMLGGFVTNLKLPPSNFQFLISPMYATGSKKLTWLGFMYHTIYSKGLFRKIEPGISTTSFTTNQIKDNTGKNTFLGFRKIVPGIKFTLKNNNPRNTTDRFIQFKTFLINEDALNFYRDTVITGIDTMILNKFKTVKESRTLNQLLVVFENYRVLYPYRGELKIEQGKDFIRTAFTGNYFFNYPSQGGLSVRVFAGKFFYIGSKTFTKQFATDRYQLNMTGADGYEDYTYSDYFIGRNKFESLPSQQIMNRDGFFKVRTDLLASKVGKTDDWLMAANFTTSIPSHLNPLAIFPIKIPLKAFLDIGTYADAWKQNSNLDRFIYNAGFYIPLLKETINIYFPLLYSKIFKDYIQSTIPKNDRFLKRISFTIDISNLNFRKFDRNFNF